MAERIEKMSLPATGKTWGRYPWNEWTDGSIWRITQGEDFDCKPANMRAMLNTHGWRKGLNVATRVVGNTIEFQMTPREPR